MTKSTAIHTFSQVGLKMTDLVCSEITFIPR